jgi:hypothetical protein
LCKSGRFADPCQIQSTAIDEARISLYTERTFLSQMAESTVTTEMLYELIKEMKSDMNRRFTEIDRRFAEMDRKLDDLRDEIRRDKEKLEKVYESRDKVTVQFTRAWMGASFLIALFTLIGGFALARVFI